MKIKRVEIRSPKDADRLGIGVVHQHFKLVSSMDAVENIEIALSDKEYKNKADIRKRITDVAKKYGFTVNPDKKNMRYVSFRKTDSRNNKSNNKRC